MILLDHCMLGISPPKSYSGTFPNTGPNKDFGSSNFNLYYVELEKLWVLTLRTCWGSTSSSSSSWAFTDISLGKIRSKNILLDVKLAKFKEKTFYVIKQKQKILESLTTTNHPAAVNYLGNKNKDNIFKFLYVTIFVGCTG